MTDDLRTRAREAAYEQCANDEQGDAFIDGALWHASTLPTRHQIAEVLWNRTNRDEENPAMMPFDEACSVEREHWMKDADAVLALWDGAGS